MPYRLRGSQRQPTPDERRWVFLGAISLAGVAGFVNVVALGFYHVPVSHMSGAISRLSSDLATVELADMEMVVAIVIGFLAGSVLSGLIIGGRKLVPGRRYGVTLFVEGAVLAAATLLLEQEQSLGIPLAAMACGIQNAMASSYYGLVIRTTHVTGIVTDIGVMVGHWVRHRRIQVWKLGLLVGILGGFSAGGVLGALAYVEAGVAAMGIASAGCVVAGGAYFVWRHLEAAGGRRTA